MPADELRTGADIDMGERGIGPETAEMDVSLLEKGQDPFHHHRGIDPLDHDIGRASFHVLGVLGPSHGSIVEAGPVAREDADGTGPDRTDGFQLVDEYLEARVYPHRWVRGPVMAGEFFNRKVLTN